MRHIDIWEISSYSYPWDSLPTKSFLTSWPVLIEVWVTWMLLFVNIAPSAAWIYFQLTQMYVEPIQEEPRFFFPY